MIFVVGTFVLVVGIVYGLYWLFVEREDAEHQHALRKRLKRPTAKSVITAALLKEKDRLSDVGAFESGARQPGSRHGPDAADDRAVRAQGHGQHDPARVVVRSSAWRTSP